MREAGRIAAAIEVLEDLVAHHRPASTALADWGRSHRFAGAGDRAAIGNLVFDTLRRRLSAAARAGSDAPRHLVMASLVESWGHTPDHLTSLFDGSRHAPAAITSNEIRVLEAFDPSELPEHVAANVPEWLWPEFVTQFGDEAVDEGRALAERAPLDLRVNTLKSAREQVAKALNRHNPQTGRISDTALRIPPPQRAGRTPNVQADAAYQRGHFEVQDEGSQIVSDLVFAQPGEQVLDYCAGGGGKSLALAARMDNRGQIFAHDVDRQRLAPIFERIRRAGARNIQVRGPDGPPLDDLIGRMNRVVVDAPCTGTGVWRRRPDAKWRLTEQALEKRIAEQAAILSEARNFVRPGGYLVYITCSVLSSENEAQIADFLSYNPDFELISAEEAWRELYGFHGPSPWSNDAMSLTLTPAATGTDGFYFAVMERRGDQ